VTIDDFAYNFSAKAFAIASTGNGLFVAGSGKNSDTNSGERWLVRKGTSDGAGGFHWQNVDELQNGIPGKWSESRASALGVDNRGNVYAVGRSYAQRDGHMNAHWTVRRASNKGTDWTVQDMFQLESACRAAASGIAVDSQGGVYVVGQARSDKGIHWIVRQSATGEPGSWSVSDDFRLTAPPPSVPMAANLFAETAGGTVMATSPTENSKGLAILGTSTGIFAGGSAQAGPVHAIVRKLELDRAGELTAANAR
jgi:hypothetical protein